MKLRQPKSPVVRKSTSAEREKIRMQKTKFPHAGLFYVADGKPWVEGAPWEENPSVSGFRTYRVGHPDFWMHLADASIMKTRAASSPFSPTGA